MKKKRCVWAESDPLYRAYHDEEWGVPVYDDQKLFEFLVLEGMQAGLSWITILKKRDAFRTAFLDFDAEKVALFSDQDVARLLENKGIIRNRLKILSVITNAKAFLALQKEMRFSEFLWQIAGGTPHINHWKTLDEVPASTEVSDGMSKSLKQKGFKFVGPTICYAFMQATGMVNDHLLDCYRHKILMTS